MVLDISPEKEITALNRKDGLFTIQAKAVILAMGCRERPRGALNIPGYRPAGMAPTVLCGIALALLLTTWNAAAIRRKIGRLTPGRR
mgnify:CR=1 FL=1